MKLWLKGRPILGYRKVSFDICSIEVLANICLDIVHLRGYKSFDEGGNKEWRYYQELAPYGDLRSLIAKYKYFNTFLPEAFLWHIFNSLAEAAEKMKQCHTSVLDSGLPSKRTNSELVHMDIKPPNILIGYPDRRDQKIECPLTEEAKNTVI